MLVTIIIPLITDKLTVEINNIVLLNVEHN